MENTFDVTDEAVDTLVSVGKREELVEGLYAVRVIEANNKDNPRTSDMQLSLKYAILDKDGNATDRFVYHNLTVPLPNPRVDGHAIKSPFENSSDLEFTKGLVKKAGQFVRIVAPAALGETCRWNPEAKSWSFNGTEISQEEATAKRKLEKRQILEALKGFYTDPAQLVGMQYFAQLKPSGKYTNVKWISAESRDNTVLFPSTEA